MKCIGSNEVGRWWWTERIEMWEKFILCLFEGTIQGYVYRGWGELWPMSVRAFVSVWAVPQFMCRVLSVHSAAVEEKRPVTVSAFNSLQFRVYTISVGYRLESCGSWSVSWWVPLNTVMNIPVAWKAGNFLANCATVSFSITILFIRLLKYHNISF